jgi:hypothetical protein
MRKLIFSANGPFLLIDGAKTRRIPALDRATRNLADALNRLTAVGTVLDFPPPAAVDRLVGRSRIAAASAA